MNKLRITEFFTSIQGESTFAGELCTFIRLSGCNLRCTYCDTTYSYYGGEECTIAELVKRAEEAKVSLVEITGGEPLLQSGTPALAKAFIKKSFTVLIETNGSKDISVLPKEVIKILDIKTPDSGEGDSFFMDNLSYLTLQDEVKFVITSRHDFEWARDFIKKYPIKGTVIFSPAWEDVTPATLVEWIVQENVPVRVGIQIHKVIWDKDKKGV